MASEPAVELKPKVGFLPAARHKAKLRLALAGPSGSGKTLSALRIAKGMAKILKCKIALIDTEKRSSELYAGVLKSPGLPKGWQVEFSVLPINPPFDPVKKYVRAIKLAEAEGFGILIIDSASHAWNGEGGILQMVDAWTAADPKHNSFAAWAKATPIQNELLNAILQSEMHVIVTMRSKVAWEITKDDRGRTRPEKVGLAPVQRTDLDYEFTTWLDLSVDGHVATAGKDRTNLFDSAPRVLTEETGKELLDWLNEGVDDDK